MGTVSTQLIVGAPNPADKIHGPGLGAGRVTGAEFEAAAAGALLAHVRSLRGACAASSVPCVLSASLG